MINKRQKSVLVLALYAGELMMKSGAEIYRVEDTVERICRVCGIEFVECFSTTTGIFLSLDNRGVDNDMHTFLKRINSTSIDLKRISLLNKFSRVFVNTDLSIDDGLDELRAIDREKTYALPLKIMAAFLIGAFMCPYYGADILGMLLAGISGAVGYIVSFAVAKLRMASFITIFISCAAVSVSALLLNLFGLSANISAVIIGAITAFMPGVAITNSARDMLSGDMLAGLGRAAEACITAVAIAAGSSVVMALWPGASGIIGNANPSHPYPLYFLYGLLMTIGFSILFNAPSRQIPVISIIGGVGMFSLVFIPSFGPSALAAVFLGSCIVGILSEIASRAGKDATTIFILPGIIPFVPGSAIVDTMSELLENGVYGSALKAFETILGAGLIAVALILIATLTRILMRIINR